MASVYSAGSASVQIVPDFSNAQRKIGQWFAKQGDLKVKIQPDLDNLDMARIRAEVSAQRPEMKVGVDRKHLANQMVQAVDFLTGTSMVAKALGRLFDVKPVLMANLGGAGVAIGTVLAQGITNAIGGAAAMLPSLVAGGAIPIGTAILGSQGVGDAFKEMGGKTNADAKKLAATMKNLAPAAKDFVLQVHSMAPAFKNLRLDVQQHLFAGLGDTIKSLGEKMLPMLRGHLTGIADEIGGMGKALAGALGKDSNVADFATTIDNIKAALHGVTGAIGPLWSVFQNLATVGSGFLPGLTKSFGDLATKFASFIQQARDSGALHNFIATSMTGLKQVLGVVLNLGGALKSIFSAALPSGQVLMETLGLLAKNLNIFFKSDAAQSGLTAFFHGLTVAISGLTPGLMSLVSAVVTSVLPAMSGLAEAISPIVGSLLGQFADLLRTLGPLFYPALAEAISTALSALTPLIGVFQQLAKTVLPIVVEAIHRIAPLFAELAEGIGDALVRAIHMLASALPPIVKAIQSVAEVLVPFALHVVNFAVDILPPFVLALKGAAAALQLIAPILPALITAFVAMKVLAGINVLLLAFRDALLGGAVAAEALGATGLSSTLQRVGTTAENAAGGFKAMGTWLGPAGLIAGVAAVAFGAIANAIHKSDEEAKKFQTSLANLRLTQSFGGDAGKDAAAKLQAVRDKIAALRADIASTKNDGPVFVSRAGVQNPDQGDVGEVERLEKALRGSNAEYAKMRRELGPLGLAQAELTIAQDAYNKALAGGSPQAVAIALQHLKTAQSVVTVETNKHNDAIKSQLDLMKEQQDAIVGAANAQLAYENAQAQAQSSLEAYNKVQKEGIDDHGASERQLRGDILAVADANARKAEEENAGKTATEIHKASMDAYISTLQEYAKTLDGPAKVAMEQMIASLQASNSAANVAKSQMDELGLSVVNMPSDHVITINAPTADQKKRLEDLGYTVHNIPGSKDVVITLNDQAARDEVAAFVKDMSGKHITVTVDTVSGAIRTVGGKGGGGGSTAFGAIGGIVKPMADGGVNSLFMSGRIASVVKPNTWRIIGDRVTDDEAFIPINRSARSRDTLALTAGRMGYGLVPSDAVYSSTGDVAMSASLRDAAARQSVGTGGAAPSVAGFVNHGTVLTVDVDELARKSRRGTQRALAVAHL